MTKIKAPYNFVPLADKVVYPKWEKAVNHDVPFADSESGTISVRIKTHSPIFVKNGGEKSVVKMQRDYDWSYEVVDGVEFDLGTLFSNMEMDEVIESLRRTYRIVDQIEESDIDEYMS